MTTAPAAPPCVVGPDLNPTRSSMDKKLYRQIMLPNGLRAMLISDTVAMNQTSAGRSSDDDDDDGGEDDDEDKDDKDDNDDNNGEDDNDDEQEDDEEDEEGEDEKDGLRDAAAAMVVGVGSMYDPPEAQGLAHFLEHMLFMGTKKYPGDNAYDAFLSKHGGDNNAFTEMEYTLYHLSIQQEQLFPALDMFAQFFISPLMVQDAVEREMNAVESEFQGVRNSDQCRMQQIMIHTSGRKPDDHPFGKFAWGNLKSLRDAPKAQGVDIMKVLRSFYDQYYHASSMALVVIGAYSLDKLQDEVCKMFCDIPAAPREKQVWPVEYDGIKTWQQTLRSPMADIGLPLVDTGVQKVYRMAPVRDRHTISITWQIPAQIKNWRSRPCDYISHLLGHESEGSVLAALKKDSWATSCFVGVGEGGMEFASSHALFTATFSLSEDGMSHWKEVVDEIYVYIGMLRHYCATNNLPPWIYDELRLTYDMAYRFSNEASPESCVEHIAERMAPHFRLPAERILDGQDLLFEHDDDAVKDLLDNYLTSKNARIDILSSSFGRASDYDAKAKGTDDVDEGDEDGAGHDDATDDGDAETEVADDDNVNDTDKNSDSDMKAMMEKFGAPTVEPIFGASFWEETIDDDTIQMWEQSAAAKMPKEGSFIKLPPKNPFVPENFDLKPPPQEVTDHPMLNAAIVICPVTEGDEAWSKATVSKYDSIERSLLCVYEDADVDQRWFAIDDDLSEAAAAAKIVPGLEGTFNKKLIKYRVVALRDGGRESGDAVQADGEEEQATKEDIADNADGEDEEDPEAESAMPVIPPPQQPSRLPKLIYDEGCIKVWHLQDRVFKRPTADLRTRLICGNSNKTVLHALCSDLSVNLVADALVETSYLASVSELGSSFSGSEVGITFRVNGFNDKLLVLYKTMLETLLSFRGRKGSDGLPSCIQPGRFEAVVEVLRRKYANVGLKTASQTTEIRVQCLRRGCPSSEEKAAALETLTEATFVETMADMMQSVAVETLYHGNITLADAKEACDLIVDMINKTGGADLPKANFPTEHVVRIPAGTTPLSIVAPSKDPAAPTTSVEMYFQVGKDEITSRVMSDLLTHIMYEPFYKQLRTDDQFGYTVGCDSRWTVGVVGIYFYVVSPTKSAKQIVERIERFLSEYRRVLVDMSDATFKDHLVGIVKQKLDMFNSLAEECSTYWSEIREFRYDWQVQRNEALALCRLTKTDALECYDKWLNPYKVTTSDVAPAEPNPLRRSLFVQVIGANDEGDAAEGRPEVPDGIPVGEHINEMVRDLRAKIGDQTWGTIY